jgi:cytochrome c oxidase assembly factor CtaG
MRSGAVHAVQHATFFATALHTSVLGALITVARQLLYPVYALRGQPWAVDTVEDQELAGLITWGPGGLALTLAALALFAAWLGAAARNVAEAERRRA